MDNPQQAVYAYLAGLIDGEGTISVRKSSSGIYQAEVLVSNTSQALIDWLDSSFEGGLSREANSWPYRPKWKPSLRWQINGRKALALLQGILPYLVIKREHASLMIEFLETCSPGQGNTPTEYQKARRDEICTRMKELNRRGRAAAETE